jgi:hypothetical protein
VQVIHDRFQYWGLVFTPTPTVRCVTRFDDTHWSAVFGYDNPLDIEVGVPLGASNQLVPAAPGYQPVTSFAPGVHPSVFIAPFDGSSIGWKLGNQTATAGPASPRCQIEEYPPQPPSAAVLYPGESAGPAGPSLSGRFQPDTLGPGRVIEAAPLPWGVGTASGVFALQAPAAFRLHIVGGNMYGSDDGCGRPELYVRVHIEGVDQGTWHFPECPAVPAACGSQIDSQDFIIDVPADQPTVAVTVELREEDGGLCGSDDRYLTAHLVVDNANGSVSGSVDNFDGEGEDAPLVSTTTFGPSDCLTDICEVENLGSRFEFSVEPAGKPRICTHWNANFVDAGFGEDFFNVPVAQQIPASFARARLAFSRNGQTPVTIDAPLDAEGCVLFDLSPDLADLVDPAGGALTIAMQLSSQFCLDETGFACESLSGDPSGARFIVGPNTTGTETPPTSVPFPVAPITLCQVITQDETLAVNGCAVVPASAGAFAGWTGKLPPSRIVIGHADEDDVTRVSAVVSHMLQVEHTTEGELGIQLALDPGQIDIATNAACDFGSDGLSTCGGDPIRIQAAPGCTGSEPPEECRNSDSRWKAIVSHEIGHVLQRRSSGSWNAFYEFTGGDNDHPGAPPMCRCDHVGGINSLHCLQSLEKPGAAQAEGYAQYVAARSWNDLDGADCVLPYYKQFLWTECLVAAADCAPDPISGLVINSPPVPRSCIEPTKWRNTQCLSGTFGPDEVVSDLSVESDWMGFYYGVTKPQTVNRFTVPELADVYLATCSLASGACQPGWRSIPAANVTGIVDGAEALFTAGGISNDQRQQLLAHGAIYGVSEDTSP